MTKTITQKGLERSILNAMGISKDEQADFCLQATECVAFYTGTRVIWDEDVYNDEWLSLVMGVAHNLADYMPDELRNTFAIAMEVFKREDPMPDLKPEVKMTFTLAHSVANGMISVLHEKGILPKRVTFNQLIDETMARMRGRGQVNLLSIEPSEIKLREASKTFQAKGAVEKFMLGMTDQVVGAYLKNSRHEEALRLEDVLSLINGAVEHIESVPFSGGSNDEQ